MSDKKIVDEQHKVSSKKGNGVLRREIWANSAGDITRYNLAYINHQLFKGDNGRVIGFDNAHGYHHKHYFGKVESVNFTDFESIEILFEQEWLTLRKK